VESFCLTPTFLPCCLPSHFLSIYSVLNSLPSHFLSFYSVLNSPATPAAVCLSLLPDTSPALNSLFC
jgi:hypothetical protein